jgi:hypothetical protein
MSETFEAGARTRTAAAFVARFSWVFLILAISAA